MRDKFSIVTQLDLMKLDEKIVCFSCSNHYDPYIFVNNATLQELKKLFEQETAFTSFDEEKNIYNGLISKYHSYKVFENNDLKFGEIELR